MSPQTLKLRVGGILFGLLAMAQLMRLLIRPEVLVAGHLMPLWPSMLAFLVLGGLSFWLLKPTHPKPMMKVRN